MTADDAPGWRQECGFFAVADVRQLSRLFASDQNALGSYAAEMVEERRLREMSWRWVDLLAEPAC